MPEQLSSLVIPLIIGGVGILFLLPKKQYFDSFLAGARSGMETSFRLLPTLAALMVAVSMFTASGAVELLEAALSPAMSALGIPAELLPLIVTRPVSGSASNAVFLELMERCGADSLPVLCASVILGSSDTMIYVMAVYFSAAGVKKTRHTALCAALTMIFCIFLSCITAKFIV